MHLTITENVKLKSAVHRIMAGAVMMLMAAGIVHGATFTAYNDLTTFTTATGGFTNSVENFDSAAADTIIAEGSSLGDITFSSTTGSDLIISNMFDTSSSANYLGVDDGGEQTFLSGEDLVMTFASPVFAIGLNIIGSLGDVWADDFTLTTDMGGSVSNSGTPAFSLGDGDVFFVGLVSDTAFSIVTLGSIGNANDPFYSWNIDDITTGIPARAVVPEPSTIALLLVGSLGLMVSRRTKPSFPTKHT